MTKSSAECWKAIELHPEPTLTQLFDQDDARVETMGGLISWGKGETANSILFDWSKTHLTDGLLSDFEALAEAMDFAGKRAALLGGEVVNQTEGRAATHRMFSKFFLGTWPESMRAL